MSKYNAMLKEFASKDFTPEELEGYVEDMEKNGAFKEEVVTNNPLLDFGNSILAHKAALDKKAANIEVKALLSNDKEAICSRFDIVPSILTSAFLSLRLLGTKHARFPLPGIFKSIAIPAAIACTAYDISTYKQRYTNVGINSYFATFMTSGRGIYQMVNNYLLPQTVFFAALSLAKVNPLLAAGLAVGATSAGYFPLSVMLESKFLKHAAEQRTYDRFYPNLDEKTTAPGKDALHMQLEYLPSFPNMMLLEAAPDSEVPAVLRDFRSATFKEVKAMKEHGIVTDKDITSIPTMKPHPLVRKDVYGDYNTVPQAVQNLDVFFGLNKPTHIAPETRQVMLNEVDALYNKFYQ